MKTPLNNITLKQITNSHRIGVFITSHLKVKVQEIINKMKSIKEAIISCFSIPVFPFGIKR